MQPFWVQFFDAVRAIKQQRSTYNVTSIFATGPFSILFMHGGRSSPFNVSQAVRVPFFTEEQVAELLGQHAAAKGISLEAGVIADIHRFTAGHAGLVCGCGRAFESAPALKNRRRISLAAWQEFRVVGLIDSLLGWQTIGNMADSVPRLIAPAKRLLVQALIAGDAVLNLASADPVDSGAARYLAAEGWLVDVGPVDNDSYRVTSPLVRSLAMRQLAKERVHELTAPLPIIDGGELDVPAALRSVLPFLRADTMRTVYAVSTKLSEAPATIFALPDDKRVPNEAAYHFELFAVFRQWLGFWQYADVFPEVDVQVTGQLKRFADMLISPTGSAPLKHILALAASTDASDIRTHYSRTIRYMGTHATTRGTCITFTAVVSSAAVSSVSSDQLVWPELSQLSSGLVAIHVVHDLTWTFAQVWWKSAAGQGEYTVKLAKLRRRLVGRRCVDRRCYDRRCSCSRVELGMKIGW